jgi:hypothetical protein
MLLNEIMLSKIHGYLDNMLHFAHILILSYTRIKKTDFKYLEDVQFVKWKEKREKNVTEKGGRTKERGDIDVTKGTKGAKIKFKKKHEE